MKIDHTDYKILNILQRDSRTTLKCIGDQVGLTAPAVSERIRRLEDKGVIQGFRIHVDRGQLDCGITGFILVSLEPEKYNRFCSFCEKEPAIISHYRIIGVFNALLQFAVPSTTQLEELLTEIKGYGDSQTSISLKTYFDGKDIPLPDE